MITYDLDSAVGELLATHVAAYLANNEDKYGWMYGILRTEILVMPD